MFAVFPNSLRLKSLSEVRPKIWILGRMTFKLTAEAVCITSRLKYAQAIDIEPNIFDLVKERFAVNSYLGG